VANVAVFAANSELAADAARIARAVASCAHRTVLRHASILVDASTGEARRRHPPYNSKSGSLAYPLIVDNASLDDRACQLSHWHRGLRLRRARPFDLRPSRVISTAHCHNRDGMFMREATPTEPRQSFATEALGPTLVRPSLVARAFMRVVAWAERLNLTYSKVGNPPVYDTTIFPWVAELEREWRAIRAELERVLMRQDELPPFQMLATDVKTITTDERWKTFFLVGFGVKSERNIARCPQTWRIVQNIPGLKTAMFSIFEPGKHLPAHRGPYNGVLRLHLGLIVPEPRDRIAIRVANQIYHWQEGKAVVFDDAYEHEAWNDSDKTRVVLFVDFVKPLRFPANLVNWLLLNLAVFTPFIREGMDAQKAWERRFYAEAEAIRNVPTGRGEGAA
jgi:ornithine lipid ester-linked acyl 2-hydroxylase